MLLNHGGARLATEGGLKFSVKPLKFSAKPKLFISWDCTESYLPQRFWREGWICNKGVTGCRAGGSQGEVCVTLMVSHV